MLSASNYASAQRFQQADADYKKAIAGAARARATLDAATRQLAVIETQKRFKGSGLSEEEAIMAAFEENAHDLARVGGK